MVLEGLLCPSAICPDGVENFKWDRSLPFAHWYYPVTAAIAYWVVILGVKKIMSYQKTGFELKPLLAIHNLLLSVGSLYILINTIESLYNQYQEYRLEGLICHLDVYQGSTWFWSYVFYLTKYYELIDTLFLVLRKKPLTKLHTIHHTVVLLMFWTYMDFGLPNQWIQSINNLAVHVFMYYYFSYMALPRWMQKFLPSVWWRRYLTQMQIIQFFADFILTFINLAIFDSCYDRFIETVASDIYILTAVIFCNAVGIMFIFMFTNFYIQTYLRGGKGGKKGGKEGGEKKKEKATKAAANEGEKTAAKKGTGRSSAAAASTPVQSSNGTTDSAGTRTRRRAARKDN